jgi:hypothetical protein
MDVCYIIAPHEINPVKIKRPCKQLEKHVIFYSQANDANLTDARVFD